VGVSVSGVGMGVVVVVGVGVGAGVVCLCVCVSVHVHFEVRMCMCICVGARGGHIHLSFAPMRGGRGVQPEGLGVSLVPKGMFLMAQIRIYSKFCARCLN